MKITEKTAPAIRVFQLELSEIELREIERCLCLTGPEVGRDNTAADDINYRTWDAIDTYIITEVDKD